MLGLKLNHVSKRVPWKHSWQFFMVLWNIHVVGNQVLYLSIIHPCSQASVWKIIVKCKINSRLPPTIWSRQYIIFPKYMLCHLDSESQALWHMQYKFNLIKVKILNWTNISLLSPSNLERLQTMSKCSYLCTFTGSFQVLLSVPVCILATAWPPLK